MRRFSFAVLFALVLAACTQQHSMSTPDVQKHADDEAWLLQHGNDATAQLELGKYYCMHEPAGSGNPKAVAAWEKTIAINTAHPGPLNDTSVSAYAMENLGMLYLSFYEDANAPFGSSTSKLFFDPEKDKLHAYCTGRKAGHTDFAAAEKWLTACASDKHESSFFTDTGACMAALGHLNARYKHYSKAYYWYAMVLAASLQSEYYLKGKDMTLFSADDPLLHKPNMTYAESSNLEKMARHLSKQEIAKLNHAVTVSELKRWRVWEHDNESWERRKDAGRAD